MDDFVRMHIFERDEDAGCEETGLFLSEAVLPADMVPEITPWHQVHNQVERISILEGLSHINNELVFEDSKQFSLVADGLVAFFSQNPI